MSLFHREKWMIAEINLYMEQRKTDIGWFSSIQTEMET
jgi:hypothetical protein